MSDPHTTYVALAYGIAGLVVAALIAKIMLDYRALRTSLEALGAPIDEREDAP